MATAVAPTGVKCLQRWRQHALTVHHSHSLWCGRIPPGAAPKIGVLPGGLYFIDGFLIPAARCIVQCVTAKQTHAKHMVHVEALSVAMEAVSFSTFQLQYEPYHTD